MRKFESILNNRVTNLIKALTIKFTKDLVQIGNLSHRLLMYTYKTWPTTY